MHKVREELRAIAFPYFQRLVLKRYGQHIPLDKIRGEFEREELALAPSPDIRVEPLEITYRGKMHHGRKLPTVTLPSDIVAYDPERDFDSDLEEESDKDDEHEEWDDDDSDDEDENEDDEYDESTSYED